VGCPWDTYTYRITIKPYHEQVESEYAMPKKSNLEGRKFGHLTPVAGYAGRPLSNAAIVLCVCDCGRFMAATRPQLICKSVTRCFRCKSKSDRAKVRRAQIAAIQARIEHYAIAA
jgi:hypothetical protein